MKDISGLKHKEIAKIMEMPLGTVLWKYQMALKKLKKGLE
jgi:DNA-directed RNA polymerase specialized sigma24 family protein